MSIDYPDWLQITGGGWRYAGTFPRALGQLAVVLLPAERALLIKVPGGPADGRNYSLTVEGTTTGIQTLQDVYTGGTTVLAYVNPALDPSWTVFGSTGVVGADDWHVFADTGLPIIDIAGKGAQLAATSVPVAIALDQIDELATIRQQSVNVGPTNPMFVRISPAGQTNMFNSVPVAIANDQSAFPVGLQVAAADVARNNPVPILAMARSLLGQWVGFHQPAAATTANVTKATAGAGVRNVIDSLTVSLRSAAGAASAVTVTVWDGAVGSTALWSCLLSIPATAGAIDRLTLSGLGIFGTANTQLQVNIPAGAANTFVAIAASGWVQA